MFIKRIVSSLILTVAFVLSLFVFPKWVFATLVIIFCALGTYEFFQLIKKKGKPTLEILGTFIAAAIPFSIFKEFEWTKGWELFFIVLAILIFFVIQFTRKNNTDAIEVISLTLFGVFYVSWLLSFVMRIFLLPKGGILVFYLLLVTKMGDVGAYIVGTNFGKHPLISRISPKKTVEGAIFAFLATLLFSCLSKIYLPLISLRHLFLLGLLLGVLGQVGDLSESLIKRNYEAKDSGFLIPGFGGMLDLIDSILFTAPALYFYLTHTAILQ
jgi:phosphatidate cytidylyltransferase